MGDTEIALFLGEGRSGWADVYGEEVGSLVKTTEDSEARPSKEEDERISKFRRQSICRPLSGSSYVWKPFRPRSTSWARIEGRVSRSPGDDCHGRKKLTSKKTSAISGSGLEKSGSSSVFDLQITDVAWLHGTEKLDDRRRTFVGLKAAVV